MTRYTLKLFKNLYGVNGRQEASLDHLYSESSFQRCGSETTYSNADSLKSPADVTQAGYIFDAVLDDRSHVVSSSDDEKSDCSIYVCNGLLITPIPRRYAIFSPPKSMFVGVPRNVRRGLGKPKPIRKVLSWKRSYAAKSSRASQSSIRVQSPYLSKKALSKLSPALRNSDQVKGSPWQKPASHIPLSSCAYECDKIECAPPSMIDMEIVRSSTSDSDTLPLVISPAYRFVPIGYESDDDCTFSCGNYDTLTKSKSDVDTSDKYSSERDSFLESKSFMTTSRSLPKFNEKKVIKPEINSISIPANEGITQPKLGNTDDELTPFEMDQRAQSNNLIEELVATRTPIESDQILKQTESSSSFDPSEEFSIMSFCDFDAVETKSIDNDVGRKNEKQIHFKDWWYIWSQLASVITCGGV